ncbi:hypothetical protein DPEC_G00288600 [Dallia pectoralis]|uniref:Uncharacterized protein n=1 Tax=Dallia pectoralis TaxID=75939 RepID=A0ACC2FKY7_DALPE|nr:hypothetical protein DPEC_G00288600 [Dallia pectoralis]
MDEGTHPFKYPFTDFLFTIGGLLCFVLDILLDVLAVGFFYLEGDYWYMGMLVFLLLSSSLLVQIFSFLWFFYDQDFSTTESLVKDPCALKIIHVFQMGVFLRYAGVVKISICGFCCKKSLPDPEGEAVFQSHDLSMLRMFETFYESAPQLVLMVTIMIQKGEIDPITLLKAFGSVAAISVSVTMYHRSLRSFLPNKDEQSWGSSVVYFLWNLLLIGPRVAAVALFASIFPCYIAAHFLCSWMVLFLCAWRLHTDFMESTGGERLYKATIGLIWYFSWFNVEKGSSKCKSTIYHIWIVLDIGILCGVWVWQMKKSPPYFHLPIDPYVIFAAKMSLYFSGLGLKVIYYKYCHPKRTAPGKMQDEVDLNLRCMPSSPPKPVPRINKRMRNLADNFY